MPIPEDIDLNQYRHPDKLLISFDTGDPSDYIGLYMRKDTEMKMVRKKIATSQGIAEDCFILFYNHAVVAEDATPQSLGIKHGDSVLIHYYPRAVLSCATCPPSTL